MHYFEYAGFVSVIAIFSLLAGSFLRWNFHVRHTVVWPLFNRKRNMSICRRKKTLVDRELQLGLASRLLAYWGATWLAVFAVPIMTQMFMAEVSFAELANKMISDLWFPMTMSLFVLPIVARDCVRFSNRVAGPIWRLKQTIRDINDDKDVRTIKLREGDYCVELADEVNRLIEKRCAQSFSETSASKPELRVANNESAAS